MSKLPVLRHLKTNALYFYKGENIYQNMVTKKEGLVSDEKANLVFAVNLDATRLINENPLLQTLIEKLELKIAPNG